jgi:hypothetical protein
VAKIPSEIADRVDGYISKYMGMLDIDGEPPKARAINSPSADWLARTRWNVERPQKTVLEFQKALFKNDKNDDWLERSIAHEMIHYRDALARADRATDYDPSGHGPSFHEGVARINAVMGPDYVTDEAVKLPTGTFLSTSDLEAVQDAFIKKLMIALGVGGLAVLGVVLARRTHPSPQPSQPSRENDRGNYGTKR